MRTSSLTASLLAFLLISDGCSAAKAPRDVDPEAEGSGGGSGGEGGAAAENSMQSGGAGSQIGAEDSGAEAEPDAAPPFADAAAPQMDGGASLVMSSVANGDRKIGPQYTNAPELRLGAGVPQGDVVTFQMKSSESQIYPGDAPNTGAYTRTVAVYIPKQYVVGTPAPLMVVQDGSQYVGRTITILNNLIHVKKLPPIVVVFAESGGGDARMSQRGIEYDTVSGKYATWAETELLPRAEKEILAKKPERAVTFTKDPDGRATMGGSSGGCASFSMAWWRPDLFRRVIAWSGTFVSQEWPANPMYPQGAWAYHDFIIKNETVRKPIRVWLQAGTNDLGAGQPANTYRNFELANIRMAAVLKEKGYAYHFDHAQNAGHVDIAAVNQTLAEAIVWAWHGHPIP